MKVNKRTFRRLMKKAVAVYGSQEKLAIALNTLGSKVKCTQNLISYWMKIGYVGNLESLIGIQIVTGGAVKVGDFVPGLSFDTRMSLVDPEVLALFEEKNRSESRQVA